MADCYLTEQQKELLRSLVPGLQDGTVKSDWTLVAGGGELLGVFGLEDSELFKNVWKGVTPADFDAFVDCGFFRYRGPTNYTLNTQKIIDVVNNNFQENRSPMSSNGTITVIPNFGPPLTTEQFQCDVFMVMPFKLIPLYNNHIKPAVEAAGLKIKLGNDFFSKHDIIKEIWSGIYNSKFLIADCTDKNANVFYELGIAHVLDKPVIMIAQNKGDIPFDVQSKRYILYEANPSGLKNLENDLRTAIARILSDLRT